MAQSAFPDRIEGRVRAITFRNRSGLKLFGIFHQPQGARRGPAVILLCPGVKNRVAPQRLYVKMAKRFCSMGFAVLRFDFHGIGDSEGEVGEEYAADFYGTVQAGRYVEDTQAAMDWMQKNAGAGSFILAGLCGGAVTGLLAGARDRRVCGLLALGIPVVISGKSFDPSKYITRGQLARLRGKYITKMGDPLSWARLLTFQSDYRKIIRSLCSSLLRAPGRVKTPGSYKVAPDGNGNLNPLFHGAFNAILENGSRVIFIFSGSDRLQWEFEEKFAGNCDLAKWGERFRKHTVPHANHVFSFSEWQESMLDIACDWLKPYTAATAEGRERSQHSL